MIGTQPDFVHRLKAALPVGWFAGLTPTLDALLNGLGASWSSIYAGLSFVTLQQRIATATGVWLDAACADYLVAFARRTNEPDAIFSLRVRSEILRPRNTRAAIIRVLRDLTGNTAGVFRPSNASDTGGWNTGALGYNAAGAYGSYSLPFQSFVTIQRGNAHPLNVIQGPASGFGSSYGGWGRGALAYGDASKVTFGAVTDADLYAAVSSVTPDGHINWVKIISSP